MMLIKKNNMTFDDSDPRCNFVVANTNATHGFGKIDLAFITVVDDKSQNLKHYFGVWLWSDMEKSISDIMDVGGKWPDVLENVS